MSEMHRIDVSEEDLLSLDGKCPKSIQDIIDRIHINNQAKTAFGLAYGLEPHLAVVLSEWLRLEKETEAKGEKVQLVRSTTRYCRICGNTGGYETYKRSSYGHQKGDLRKDRPLQMGEISLFGAFNIRMCYDCFRKVKAVKYALEAAQNA